MLSLRCRCCCFFIQFNTAKKSNNNRHQEQEPPSNNQVEGPTSNENSNEIVLGVNLPCLHYVETAMNALREFDGIEEIKLNTKEHRVCVKGEKLDSLQVAERLKQNMGKHVDIIFPVLKKPKAPKVDEVALKIDAPCKCDGCIRKIKRYIQEIEGVQVVDVELAGSSVRVNVRGHSIDEEKLVGHASKKCKAHVEKA